MPTYFQIAGLILDMIGVLFMSYSYFSTTEIKHVPGKLLQALRSLRTAEFLAKFSQDINGHQYGRALQGLSIIMIGFFLQLIGLLLSLLKT